MSGDVHVRFCEGLGVRFPRATRLIVGFQHQRDAEQFLTELRERFAQYDLELHPEKTRLIEFGRFAASNRKRRGQGKPETFDFLGFTHICATSRRGSFLLRRRTIGKRLRAKLVAVKEALRKRMHIPVAAMGFWLNSVLRGYFQYHAVPTNRQALVTFRREVSRAWLRTLRRRSHKDRTTWEDLQPLLERWLPTIAYCHPWPDVRFEARHYSR